MAMRRPRVIRRRRAPRRRRRLVRRRVGAAKKDRFAASAQINLGGWNYTNNRKRLSRRALKNQQYKASTAAQHFRSNNAVPITVTSPANRQQGNTFYIPWIADGIAVGTRFWEAGGGLITLDGASATTDFGSGDLFMRGGKATLTIENAALTPMIVRTWKIRSKRTGFPVTANPKSQDWDPSIPGAGLDFQQFYSFYDNIDYIIRPGDCVQRVTRIPSGKIDQSQYIIDNEKNAWIVYIQNPGVAAVGTVEMVHSHNLSFTGDRTV